MTVTPAGGSVALRGPVVRSYPRMVQRVARGVVALAGTLGIAGMLGCGPGQRPAGLDELRQPTGLAVSDGGRWLFVTNGNWDRGRFESSLVVVDLAKFERGLDDPRAAGASVSNDAPCRQRGSDAAVECAPAPLIREELTVRLPSGAGNIGVDRGLEGAGEIRLLIPTRLETGLWWIDVAGLQDDAPPTLRCDQDDDRHCGPSHAVAAIRPEPSRIVVDDHGYPYAYLPHLLDRRFSLIRLRGERGPEVADVEEEFYRLDPLFDSDLGGGFGVAARPCDPAADNVPRVTLDCERPLLYTTHRYWFGVRTFRVAPGLDVVIPGSDFSVPGSAVQAADPRPLMGDLRFVDPDVGDELLVVNTTPPALSLVDTSLDDRDEPVDALLRSIPLCGNPNLLELYRPPDEPWLAFVTCPGQDRVQVIDVEAFEVIRSIPLGRGANEIAVDGDGARLYVANTGESTISVIDLSRGTTYLTEIGIIGLGGRARVP